MSEEIKNEVPKVRVGDPVGWSRDTRRFGDGSRNFLPAYVKAIGTETLDLYVLGDGPRPGVRHESDPVLERNHDIIFNDGKWFMLPGHQRMAELEETCAELARRVTQLEAKRGPGRPPKKQEGESAQ